MEILVKNGNVRQKIELIFIFIYSIIFSQLPLVFSRNLMPQYLQIMRNFRILGQLIGRNWWREK